FDMIYSDYGQLKTTYAADIMIFPLAQDRALFAVLMFGAFVGTPALALAGIPPFHADYVFKAVLTPFLILSLAALGLNILVGYCGQISLGAGAFMAVGAYAAFNFASRVPELPILFAILLGGGVA